MLINMLDIKKNDFISIVGSGGKTTLMYYISDNFHNSKTLITTSTKIFKPNPKLYDNIFIGEKNLEIALKSSAIGRYLVGKSVDENNKILGFSLELLNSFKKYFDLCIIESDGSKMKLLKGWKDREPVVSKLTTKTIGIINLKSIGKPATENIIHNLPIFLKISDCHYNEEITSNHIKNIILHPSGLFKNFIGEKILYINKIDSSSEYNEVLSFFSLFKEKEAKEFDKIIFGSLKKENFHKWKF